MCLPNDVSIDFWQYKVEVENYVIASVTDFLPISVIHCFHIFIKLHVLAQEQPVINTSSVQICFSNLLIILFSFFY